LPCDRQSYDATTASAIAAMGEDGFRSVIESASTIDLDTLISGSEVESASAVSDINEKGEASR
jgi:hypothetical protein